MIMTVEEFKEGLETLGWKQSDFAMATGLSKVGISNWMTATAPLPLWAQHHLALLLKLHDLAAALLTPPVS